MKFSTVLFLALICILSSLNLAYTQWVHADGDIQGDVKYLNSSGRSLFAVTNIDGIYRSSDNGRNWTYMGFADTVAHPINLTMADGGIYITYNGGSPGGLYRSTDDGISWNSLYRAFVLSFAAKDTILFAGVYNDGVFRSTDNGKNWNSSSIGLPVWQPTPSSPYIQHSVWCLLVDSQAIFAGDGGGICTTTDNGANWAKVGNLEAETLDKCGKDYFAANYRNLARSTDGGLNWLPADTGLNLSSNPLISVTVADLNVFVLTTAGLFVSTNSGSAWNSASQEKIDCFAVKDRIVFAQMNGCIFLSMDTCKSWLAANTGLPNVQVTSLAIIGDEVFAATKGSGIWYRPLSEMITSVERPSKQLPDNIAVVHIYPNPFNPTTTIAFTIPSKSFVSLKIFDTLGRLIATPISQEMSAGSHSTQWTAPRHSSGTYYCRLQGNGFAATQRLLLLK